MSAHKNLYYYRAKVVSVYDGDTFRCDIDLGMFITKKDQIIRLADIDIAELRGEERLDGLVARDRVRELILGQDVILRTYKDGTGKYGRWIADVYFYKESGEPDYTQTLTEILREEGFGT